MNVNQQQIASTAEQDAQSDVSKILWLAVGFALNVVGILIAYIYQQSPSATRIYEKTQEYVVFYSDAYKAECRKLQVKYAVIGFVITVVITLILTLAYISIIFSTYRRVWREFP